MLGAAALAGLLFAPVFGITALLLPVGLVVAAGAAGAEVARRWPRLAGWQLPLTAAAALAALLATVLRPTTRYGLPTVESLRALRRGVTDSWRLTLQTTWPVGPAPDRLLFVPLLVLLAVLLGAAALRRWSWRGLALLPGLAVAGLAQAFHPVSGWTAALVALGFAVAAAAVLGPPVGPAGRPRSVAAVGRGLTVAGPLLLVGLLAAAALSAGSLAGRPPYALERTPPPQLGSPVGNPLDEIAERLARPAAEVFRVRTAAPVDRWQLVVLDRFDGAGWTPGAQYLRMGAELPPDRAVTVPLQRGEAAITLDDGSSPWLPSQRGTTAVTGLDPLVDPATGTLVAPVPDAGTDYRLSWAAPVPTAAELRGRPLDPAAAGGEAGLPEVPAGISDLAAAAVRDRGASFGSALLLAQYLREHYPLATGPTVPTGNGWIQLQRFLLQGGSGTSEQFSTGYAVLARTLGIPARVVVGFRQPDRPEPDGSYLIRNRDILAWPEVAVRGAGWVPVDPLPERAADGTTRPSAPLPPPPRPRPPTPPVEQEQPEPAAAEEEPADPADTPVGRVWLPVAGGLLLAGALGWLLGVPAAKAVRRARRRRRPGPAAVTAAWLEARDQLRAHRVPASPAMTVRDLAAAAARAGPGVEGLRRLAVSVDATAWSGSTIGRDAVDEAWAAVTAVRRDLAAGPLVGRVRAALEVRSLFPPR